MQENYVFFSNLTGRVEVYALNDDNLTNVGYFSGSIHDRKGEHPEGYVINRSGSTIRFRSTQNYNDVVFQQYAPSTIRDLQYFKNSYLLIDDQNTPFFRIFKFDIDNDIFEQIYQFTVDEINLHPFGVALPFGFNGVISRSSYNSVRTSEYFSILNDNIVQIGEKHNPHSEVAYTYFFPEQNKMVELAMHGVIVYDIEYNEYVSEIDNPIPIAKTELLGNYPNPFNPSTTIEYTLSIPSNLQIDIYNIKGQKVKSLMNEFKPLAIHSENPNPWKILSF